MRVRHPEPDGRAQVRAVLDPAPHDGPGLAQVGGAARAGPDQKHHRATSRTVWRYRNQLTGLTLGRRAVQVEVQVDAQRRDQLRTGANLRPRVSRAQRQSHRYGRGKRSVSGLVQHLLDQRARRQGDGQTVHALLPSARGTRDHVAATGDAADPADAGAAGPAARKSADVSRRLP